MKSIQKVSLETLKLETVFMSSKPGTEFTYEHLEYISGVKMDMKGKSYVRTALKRLNLPCETVRGKGIKLLSPENATTIVAYKIIKIDRSVKRAEKTTLQVKNHEEIFNSLTEKEQKDINFMAAVFAGIRSFSEQAKKQLESKPPVKIGQLVE